MDERVTKLESQRKNARMFYFIYLIVSVISLAVFFFNKDTAIVIFLLNFVVYMFFSRAKVKKFKKDFVMTNILISMEKHMKDLTYKAKNGFAKEKIDDYFLIPTQQAKGFLVRDYVSGNYKSMKVEAFDIGTHYYTTGASGKKEIVFVNGCWVDITLPRDTGYNLRSISRSFLTESAREAFYNQNPDFHPVSIGDEAIDEKFVSYSSGNDESKLPGTHFTRRLKKLADYTTGEVAVGISGDKLFFMLKGRFLSGNVNIKQPITQQMMEYNYFPEIEHLLQIAESFSNN